MKLWEALASGEGLEYNGVDITDKAAVFNHLIMTDEDVMFGFFGSYDWRRNPDLPEVLKTKNTCIEYYFNHSGNREISPIYKLFVDSGNAGGGAYLYQSDILLKNFKEKWIDYYNYIYADLSVDSEYNETVSKTGTDRHAISNDDIITDDGQVGTKVTTDYSDGVAGFNSPSYVNDTKSTRTETANSNDNTNHNTRTINANHADNLTYGSVVTKEGRNVPQVELIDKALKFKRDNIFLDMVFKDIDSVLTQPLYM